MEAFMINMGGEKRSYESPNKDSPSKRTNLVGISPQKELINVSTPSNRPFRVSVEGNIGAGKSSMMQYFSTFPGIETHMVGKILTIYLVMCSNTFKFNANAPNYLYMM